MSATRISVKGTSSTSLPADLAHLSISVTTLGPSQSATLSSATLTSSHVEALFERESDPNESKDGTPEITQWSMSSLTTSSWHEHDTTTGKPAAEATYRANLEFQIRCRDFVTLGKLAEQLAAMQHVRLERVQWLLTPATIEKHKSALRKAAVANAVKRARDYAEAMGRAVIELVELVEDDVDEGNFVGHGRAQFARQMRTNVGFGGGGGGGGGEVESMVVFRPEEIELAVGVKCTFLVGRTEEDVAKAYASSLGSPVLR